MQITFEKWHGCRNDFILIWMTDDAMILNSLTQLAPTLCARDGQGIGADGIIVLIQKHARDLQPERLVVINADGSRAKTCGNGIRCAALSVLKKNREATNIDLPEGCEFAIEDNFVSTWYIASKDLKKMGSRWPLVAVDMGIPEVNQHAQQSAMMNHVKTTLTQLQLDKTVQDQQFIKLGNEHVVLFSEQASVDMMKKIGKPLQTTPYWDGVNVHIVVSEEITKADQQRAQQDIGQNIDELFSAWVWERGVGPTQACGSGACAIAVAHLAQGMGGYDTWTAIEMPGGRLYVKQEDKDSAVVLAGPATFVFAGHIDI